jgi:hypothetical protein
MQRGSWYCEGTVKKGPEIRAATPASPVAIDLAGGYQGRDQSRIEEERWRIDGLQPQASVVGKGSR